jgi:hypothetical protein
MLYIYVSTHCPGCVTARRLAARLLELRPQLSLHVIDVDRVRDTIPANVIGTPMYLWESGVLFMGNPDLVELLERVDERLAKTRPV